MKRLLPAASILLLAGCTTSSEMDAGVGTLVGQPQQVAFDAFGYPKSQEEIAGNVVYVWNKGYSLNVPTPSHSTTSGTVNGAPYTAQTSSWTSVHNEYSCTIRVMVNPQSHIIVHTDWTGDSDGCYLFKKQLKQLRQQAPAHGT